MRARIPLTLALLLALAAPAVHASFYVEGDALVEGPHPHSPQVFCAFVFDQPGELECLRDEHVVNADTIRVRSDGRATVIARVLELPGYSYIGQVFCPRGALVCEGALWYGPHTGTVRFWTTAYDALAGAVAVADLETGGPSPA